MYKLYIKRGKMVAIANTVGTGTGILPAGYLLNESQHSTKPQDHVLKFGKYRRILVLC